MRLQIKALHDHLDDSVKAYVETRIGKLGKRLYDQTLVEVILAKEHNPSIANSHSAEVIVHTKGPNLVARASATTHEAAIDELAEKLERQIERYRDKRKLNPRRDAQKKAAAEAGAPPVEAPVTESPDEQGATQDEAAA